mmetsp:Transcript_10365/g.36449  ORF Transcript_10365/g.36449 Transcript_10365/m.36449 type:complete len:308 (+) Transcript_10365:66-989(+)
MGVSTCSQHCERAVTDTIPCARAASAAQHWRDGERQGHPTSECEQITGLSYLPPPPWEDERHVRAMLGTRVPTKPTAMDTGLHGSTNSASSSQFASGGKSYGRPGEPVNKVYVQYSNDLEGFLPYTLVISEDNGLEFFSLSGHPDFVADPLNVLQASLLDYDILMEDVFFSSLAKSITARTDLKEQEQSKPVGKDAGRPEVNFEERVQPPYKPMVQLNLRRTALEGGQVLVFIAVQTDHLAAELIRGIKQLRRRRAVPRSGNHSSAASFAGDTARSCSGVASRGCPSPRTVASQVSTARDHATGREP